MIYRFTSKAAGDTLMLGPTGDRLLRVLGREPSAAGIIEVEAMPAAIAALRQAIVEDDASRLPAADDEQEGAGDADAGGTPGRDPVSLRRRLWPMLQMLERALAEREPIVWGV